ncbi:unnamed protein product [Ilex paraguariensis]|uniref:Alliinase C-terminal domain-containing protein n=1 Tax=Ilex paraguariensis TaxID=185542 RepID=A0ABC8R0Q2_9AQUA
MGEKSTIVISGHQSISYFSDVRNLCWFLEPEFANSVVRLHKLVGNAITEDHHIVVGTGSTQLFQAVLYALSPPNASEPMNVVSAAPFYSRLTCTTGGGGGGPRFPLTSTSIFFCTFLADLKPLK